MQMGNINREKRHCFKMVGVSRVICAQRRVELDNCSLIVLPNTNLFKSFFFFSGVIKQNEKKCVLVTLPIFYQNKTAVRKNQFSAFLYIYIRTSHAPREENSDR